jgi:UDP-glucose 4-epimerase
MKKILITGKGSYIGTSFENWVSKWPDKYKVETIDASGDKWIQKSFSGFDVVYHIAAIVHVKENDTDKYFRVNRDITFEVAKKAKKEGVKQFIFLSTMGVYGAETGYINKTTKPDPKTPYAKSKLEAEALLNRLEDDSFKVSIVRPPIVYGKDCKGNYPRLARIALKLPFFPMINNERSMIFIDNLSEFIRLVIKYRAGGLFFPQNKEYVNTTQLVSIVAKVHGKDLKITKVFNPGVHLGIMFSETFRKVFGSFVYDKHMSGGPGSLVDGNQFDYETCTFKESVERTEL